MSEEKKDVLDTNLPDEDVEEEGDAIGNRKESAPARTGGRGPTLGESDPYWQFGTPVESWGSTQGRKGGVVAGTGISENDPYWKFGVPPSYWGKGQDQNSGPAQGARPKAYFECQKCGVKVERKAIHRGGAVCPFCNRPMHQVGGHEQGRRDDRRQPQRDPRPGPNTGTQHTPAEAGHPASPQNDPDPTVE